MSKERLVPLDAVRGVAAIGIAIFWHYQHFAPEVFPFSSKGYWFYHYGYLCVDLFFVLSGFVFSYVYGERLRKRMISAAEFACLRFSRLYPLAAVTLIAILLLQSIRTGLGLGAFIYDKNDVYHFLLNLLFLQNVGLEEGFSFNGPSWSISCEALAYVLFFLVLHYAGRRPWGLFAFFPLVGIVVRCCHLDVPFLNDEVSRVYISFFAGVFSYRVHLLLQRRSPIWGWMPLLVVLCLTTIGVRFGHAGYGTQWQVIYMAVLFPCVVLSVLHVPPLAWIGGLPPLRYLGRISYSLYLWHFPVQCLLMTFVQTGILQIDFSSRFTFIGYACLVGCTASLSERFFESPLRQYIRRAFKSR